MRKGTFRIKRGKMDGHKENGVPDIRIEPAGMLVIVVVVLKLA